MAACLNVISEGFGERRRSATGDTASRGPIFGAIRRDLVHAVRSLSKARAFTIVCVLSLGVGMGTVMGIVTLMRQLTAVPPDVKDEGLVEIVIRPQGPLRARVGEAMAERWSYPDFVEVSDANTGVAITGWTLREVVLRQPSGDSATREAAMYVSPNYFTTVGTPLARGTGFDVSNPGGATGAPSVIVGYRLWQSRLGSDPEIVGKSITINRIPHLVVGIAPGGFSSHLGRMENSDAQLWIPLEHHPRLQPNSSFRTNRALDWVHIIGRLAPGTTRSDANGAMTALMSRLAQEHSATNEFKSASVEPYLSARREGWRKGRRNTKRRDRPLVGGTSGGVSEHLRHGRCPQRDARTGTRGAAGHWGQSRTPDAVPPVGGIRDGLTWRRSRNPGALRGTGRAGWWFGVEDTKSLAIFQPDGWMVAICVGLCFGTSLVFGLLPAVRFSRPSLVLALKDEVGGGGRRVGRSQRVTAAIQAAIAIPFLVLGGVRLDQVRTTATADLGFDPKGLFAAPLDVGGSEITPADASSACRPSREPAAG